MNATNALMCHALRGEAWQMERHIIVLIRRGAQRSVQWAAFALHLHLRV